jgi:hypothetical protein
MKKSVLAVMVVGLLAASTLQAEAAPKATSKLKVTIENTLLTWSGVLLEVRPLDTLQNFVVNSGEREKVTMEIAESAAASEYEVVAHVNAGEGDILFGCSDTVDAKGNGSLKNISARLVVYQTSPESAPQCSLEVLN